MRKFKPSNIRLWVQVLYTILTNGYAYGFLNGKIYKGPLKYACVPGLNCYSCPGALASCPLGALQNALNQRNLEVPFAVLGFFFIFGSLLGRFVCGWLCPFGLLYFSGFETSQALGFPPAMVAALPQPPGGFHSCLSDF